jgi:hypothetical protein
MPKKSSIKTTKTAKATKKTPKAKPETKAVAPGECPKGGSHEWAEENGETFCSKCKEPKTTNAKRGTGKGKADQPAKPAKEKKISGLDAAAQVLQASKEPMNTKAMIEQMVSKGLWTSPEGKTPHATLYSAIIREITVKGKESRFKKTDRGNFAFNG